MLDSHDKRRYIAEHAPKILCALIMRRASTDPHMLMDTAIETAARLYDMVTPAKRNGNGQHLLTASA